MPSNCGAGEGSWESLGLQGDQTGQSWRKSNLNIHWKDWCCSRSPNPLATWCEELSHRKRPWCWERSKAGGEGDNRDEMVGCHHYLSGHEFEQAPGDGEGQGSLVCCSPRGHKESDMTEWLNWTRSQRNRSQVKESFIAHHWELSESTLKTTVNATRAKPLE